MELQVNFLSEASRVWGNGLVTMVPAASPIPRHTTADCDSRTRTKQKECDLAHGLNGGLNGGLGTPSRSYKRLNS